MFECIISQSELEICFSMDETLQFCLFLLVYQSSPLNIIIPPHKIDVFVYPDTFAPHSSITSAISTFNLDLACGCYCFCCYHYCCC